MVSPPLSDAPLGQTNRHPEEVVWFSHYLIDTMPVGVCVCDMDGFVVAYNKYAVTLWGQAPLVDGPERAKYCGSKNICQLDGTSLHREEFPVVQVLADGQPKRELQFLIEQPSGMRVTVVANINPILDAQGAQIGAVVCFDTRQQSELTKSLQHGAKLAASTHMSAEWAHDFNNLLHGVRWELDLIRRRLVRTGDTESCHHVDLALHEITKARPFVQRLLTLARESSSDHTLCSVDSTLISLADLMQHVLGPTVRLTLALRTPDAVVRMNRSVFEDVLMNLCMCARDAMPDGGEVVMTSCLNCPSGEASLDSITPYLALSVRDNGQGMSQEQVQHALDPSSLTKQDCDSSILGFAMAKRFTILSGGTFDLRSQSGAGTNVTMFLPMDNGLASQQSIAHAPADISGQPHPVASLSKRLRIVLVEDDHTIRQELTDRLQMVGHEVLAFPSGEEAIGLLRSEQPLDLVISDHVLPGPLQGSDVLDIATTCRPGLKTILITGLFPHHIAQKRYPMLTKPFTLEELEQALVTT